MSAAPKTPREIVAELGLPHREPVVDYYVMVAHPFDHGVLEPLRAAGYKLTPSGAGHTIVGPVQEDRERGGDSRLAAPTPEEERAIDDFVVARIDHYFEAFDAVEAFGRGRLERLEREGRIVLAGDPSDAYYARVPR